MAKKRQRPKGTGTLFRRISKGPWIASWYDVSGRRREASTRTTCRATAERILAQKIADVALRREGVIDADADRYSVADRRPIGQHVGAYVASLRAKCCTPGYIADREVKLMRILELAEISHLPDLTTSSVLVAVEKVRAMRNGDDDPGPSLRTLNKYVAAAKGFARWLRQERLTRENRAENLRGFNDVEDQRHKRRDLPDEDLRKLITVTATRDIEGGMSGADRSTMYLLAASTGYRRNELASLTPESFDLDSDPPAIECSATATKSRRADRQPIRRDLVPRLRSWLRSKSPGERVFANMPQNTARTLRWDLKAAGIPYEVDGQRFDFHALRGVYCTRIERSGATPRTLQTLARHVDARTTLHRYSRLRVHDQVRAVEATPSLVADEPAEYAAVAATGTCDDRPPDHQLYPQRLGRENARTDASRRGGPDDRRRTAELHKPRENTAQSDIVRAHAAPRENRPQRDSNPCRWLEKPVS